MARIARVAIGGALMALCVFVVWWWAIGGTWLIVRTPSMGTYAPVGTLVWVKPVNIHNLQVGDVITFHTPTTFTNPGVDGHRTVITVPSYTYTHRVVAVDPDGTVQTKGDLNQARDPWHTNQRQLVGQVMASMPGVGWLVEALPVLIPGALALWALTALLASRRARAPLRVLGAAVLVAAACYVYNPLWGAVNLGLIPLGGTAGARATYVGTGLLPIRLVAEGAHSVLVYAGQARSIVTTHLGPDNRYRVKVMPTIPWETWVVVAAAGLAPALWSVFVGTEPTEGTARHRRRHLFRRREVVEASQ